MSENIAIAVISALSAILGGITVAGAQFLLAKATETRARRTESAREFRNRFEDCLVKLIEECDPDINEKPSIPEVTRNIIRLQLYLDLSNPLHRKLNANLNRMGSSIGGYADFEGQGEILQIHRNIIDVANKIIRELMTEPETVYR